MSSSFSIVDDNDKLKYELTSVPIFKSSESAWNNSLKTNAFTINSSLNKSVLFTGCLSCINLPPRKVSQECYFYANSTTLTFWTGIDPTIFSTIIKVNMFVKGGFTDSFGNFNPFFRENTYLKSKIGTYSFELSQAPYMDAAYFSGGYYFFTRIIDVYEVYNFNNYINKIPDPFNFIIKLSLKGTTNYYIYKTFNFPIDSIYSIDSNSNHYFIPINFLHTFLELGTYDVNIYLNDAYSTDSNDFLNLNATLYDLIIPPEDNFEL